MPVESMTTRVSMGWSQLGATPGMSVMAHASRLAEEAEMYTGRVDGEKRRLAQLLADVHKVDVRLEQVKEKPRWDDVEIREEQQKHKQHVLMEERLHILTGRWATAVTENKALRADIEEERKEHMRFLGEKKRLLEVTMATEESVQDVIAASKEVFEERAELVELISTRRSAREAEQKQFVGQCRELNQVRAPRMKRIQTPSTTHNPQQQPTTHNPQQQPLTPTAAPGSHCLRRKRASLALPHLPAYP